MRLIMSAEECAADNREHGKTPSYSLVFCAVCQNETPRDVPHIHDWETNNAYCSEGCAIATKEATARGV